MLASREFIVITVRQFYATTRLNGLAAILVSSGSDVGSMLAEGCSFQANSNSSLIAPRQCGDVEHAHEREREHGFSGPLQRLRCALSPLSCAIF